MHRLAVGTLVSTLLAVSLIVVGGTGTAAAVTKCHFGSTNGLHLCDGTVSAASGTTATVFKFTVTYLDPQGRANPFAIVIIDGGAPIRMTMTGTDVKAGVTMNYSSQLPVGSHTYVFQGGQTTGTPPTYNYIHKADYNDPTPSPIVVSPAPTPTPTKPKPTPTKPRPTATPRPRATPRPTAKPSPTPTAAPVVVEVTPSPSPSPTAAASPTPTTAKSSSTPAGLGAGPVGGDSGDQNGGPGQLAPLLAVALAAAGGFLLFGAWRRRRKPGDDSDAPLPVEPVPPPAPVSAIVTPPPPTPKAPRAPRLMRPSKPVVDQLVPQLALAPAAALGLEVVTPDEGTLPRWRRPSLKAARLQSDRKPVETVPLAFAGAAIGATTERRRVRYAVVPLLDAPDEIRSTEIGQLQEGDEVELLSSEGRWMRVRTPVGTIGWVHKTTLAPVGAPAPAAMAKDTTVDDDVEMDGSGLLDEAILRASAIKLVPQPVSEPAPKPRRAPRRSRGTASAG